MAASVIRIEQQPDRHDRVGRAAEQLERAEADERAHHEHVAVGEVEELEDPVDEGVAEGDQGVDAAERQAVQRELDKGVHAVRESTAGLNERAARPCGRAAPALDVRD